jgi:O-antigen/teichoic acid export membrane protein
LKDSKPGIIKNLSVLGVADLGTAVIGGGFWLVIATLIEPEEYGEINYLLSIVGVSFSICLIGIRETIIVYTTKKNPITPTIFIITGFSGLAGFIALSGIFSRLDISFLLLGYIINELCLGYFLGLKSYKTYSKFVLVQKVSSFGLGIIFVLIFGYEGLIAALALSYIHFIFIYFKVIRKEKINFSLLRDSKFFIENYVMNVSSSFRSHLDKIILLPIVGFTIIGNYALALQVFAIMMSFPRLVFKYILPEDTDGNENKKLKIFTIIFGVVMALLGYFLSPIIIPVIFPKFLEAIAIIQIISFAAIPSSINQIQTSKLLSKEKSRSVLISRLFGLSTMITLLVILTPTMQEIGIAIAFLASSIILCISLFIFNNKQRE